MQVNAESNILEREKATSRNYFFASLSKLFLVSYDNASITPIYHGHDNLRIIAFEYSLVIKSTRLLMNFVRIYTIKLVYKYDKRILLIHPHCPWSGLVVTLAKEGANILLLRFFR